MSALLLTLIIAIMDAEQDRLEEFLKPPPPVRIYRDCTARGRYDAYHGTTWRCERP